MNTNHCAYESQHEPKNIKVQGLRGRWDVCLHAVEKNGTLEYWWVLNADGVDGGEGSGDAGRSDAENAPLTSDQQQFADSLTSEIQGSLS